MTAETGAMTTASGSVLRALSTLRRSSLWSLFLASKPKKTCSSGGRT